MFVAGRHDLLPPASGRGADRLQRNLGTVYEHALKVFETVEIASRYLDEVLNDVADEQIRANEDDFQRAAASRSPTPCRSSPTSGSIDANGRPVVSGTVFPIPRQLDLSDRAYFRAHSEQPGGRVSTSATS